jgi:Ca2+-binding EF-hand superfamily protein
MWNAHRNGKETSLNPLSMMEALVGAMQHSAKLRPGQYEELIDFSKKLQKAIHEQMVQKGTRDLDKNGLTTEQFVDAVALKLEESRKTREAQRAAAKLDPREYDEAGMRKLFEAIDANGDGTIDFGEFATGMKRFFLAQPGAKAKI